MSPATTTFGAKPGTLVLVRHGHTAMAGTFCGHSDPPLSEQGRAQLPALCERLRDYPLTHVFSSDLQRACQTAQAVADARSLKVQQLNSLREIAFGGWEGLDWDAVMAQDAPYAQRWLDLYPSMPAPGGEGLEDFRRRIQGAMDDVAAQVGDGCAVVVTHGGVIRMFLEAIAREQGIPHDFTACDYTSCWPAGREQGQWMFPEAPVTVMQVK